MTATFGLGGGVMMLIAMASVLPPLAVIPVHGAVQMGSNGGRAWVMRSHVSREIFGYFVIGSLIGAAVASQVVVALPTDMLRLVLGLFVLWVVWAPKLTRRDAGPRKLRSDRDRHHLCQHVRGCNRSADRGVPLGPRGSGA